MKSKRLIAGVAFISFLGMGTVLHEQPVSAAAWHKGTPKALRGLYQYKLPKNSALGFGTYVKISANRVEIGESGMGSQIVINPAYRKVGKYYHLEGHRIKSGMYKSGKENLMMYRINNRFSVISYRRFKERGFSNVHFAQRVNKVRDGNW